MFITIAAFVLLEFVRLNAVAEVKVIGFTPTTVICPLFPLTVGGVVNVTGPPTPKIPAFTTNELAAPIPLPFNPSNPPFKVSAPVKVFGVDGANTHVPTSDFVTLNAFAPLFVSTPDTVFIAVLTPPKVNVFAPAPVLPIEVNTSGPDPLASIITAPVVEARFTVRVTVSPAPT
jgi:hypothetical protein